MFVSLKWLKELVSIPYSVSELDNVLTMMGVEVEEIVDYGTKYKNFFTAKVLEKEKHPDADKLSICKVDYGSGVNTVVCGAPNVEAGQSVILALPGAIVPAGGFEIKIAKIRKVESSGMICSETELELGDNSSGIMVLPENIEAGIPLADYLELDDVVMDLSLTPNKSDCNSHLGIAREVAAHDRTNIRMPQIDLKESDTPTTDAVEIVIEDKINCPRYAARVIRGAKIGDSPEWLKKVLVKIGLRPRNIAVDVTNFVLMECGHPLHAFDADKLAGNKIIVKSASNGEKFTTLDDKERTLDSEMLMICDAEKPIAVAGVMGGQNSEITNDTTDIVIESAFFHPSSVRRTAKKLGINSDASYRFERGADIDNIEYAVNRAAAMIVELAGGEVLKDLIDIYPEPKEKLVLKLRYKKACNLIGVEISDEEQKDMLQSLNFLILEEDEESVTVEVPNYRVDVFAEIDLIEEIARMYNFDNIPVTSSAKVSAGSVSVPAELALPDMRSKLNDYLMKNGYNQIVTQNQVDPKSAALFTEKPVVIANPLGEELSIMRPSVMPSVLRTVARNIKIGNKNLQLFESGKTFAQSYPDEKTFIPGLKESEELVIALSGSFAPIQWGTNKRLADFYDIKGVSEDLFAEFRYENIKTKANKNVHPILSKNSLMIVNKKEKIGYLGEVKKSILKMYDIDNPVYMMHLNLSAFYKIAAKESYFSTVAPFPGITRDLAFVCDKEAGAEAVRNEINQNGGKLLKSVTLFDVYEGKSVGSGKKSLAFGLEFASPERTLVDEDAEKSVQKIIKAIERKFKAVLR